MQENTNMQDNETNINKYKRNTDRKLVSVRMVTGINIIADKDRIVQYDLDGWKVIDQKDKYKVADNRANIEKEIKEYVTEQLKAEGLDTALNIVAVQVRNVQPNAQILASATEYVQSQNQLKIKENEVKLAKLESERMQALSNNSANSIQFMQAQASLNISEAVKAGKVQTIIIPSNMTSLMLNK